MGMSDAQGRSPFCQRTPPSGISDREHGLSFGTESEGHQGPFGLSQVLTVVAGLGGGRCWVGSTMGPRWVCEDVSPGRGAAGPPRQHLVRFVGPFCHSQVAILGISEVGCRSSQSSLRSCRTPPWAGAGLPCSPPQRLLRAQTGVPCGPSGGRNLSPGPRAKVPAGAAGAGPHGCKAFPQPMGVTWSPANRGGAGGRAVHSRRSGRPATWTSALPGAGGSEQATEIREGGRPATARSGPPSYWAISFRTFCFPGKAKGHWG